MDGQDKKPDAVWQILLVKAEAASKLAQLRLKKASARKNEVLNQISKLDNLLAEYRTAHSKMAENTHDTFLVANYRQFVSQLEGIKAQAAASLIACETDFEIARQNLRSVDTERIKMESLVLKASEARKISAEYAEAKSIETENLIRHNMSHL